MNQALSEGGSALGPRQVRIRAQRDFGKARLSTLYTLRENADRIEISTTMTNEGEVPLPGGPPKYCVPKISGNMTERAV